MVRWAVEAGGMMWVVAGLGVGPSLTLGISLGVLLPHL